MIFIKKSTLQSELIGVNSFLKSVLKKELSYEDKAQVMARAVAKKRLGYIPKNLSWSGVVYLINEHDQFDSGLLPLVLRILKHHGLEYSYIMEPKLSEAHPLKMQMSLDLWSHQRDAVEAIKSNITGIIRIGTGGGKALLSVVACAEIGQFPYIIIVNRVSLLNQLHADYSKFLEGPIGYIGNGVINVQKINVATIGTLCSMLKIKESVIDNDENFNYTAQQIKEVKTVLRECQYVTVDECHHAAASTYKTILKAVPNARYRVGLSATPFRTDGADILLQAAFGDIIYNKSASELIQDGTLAQPKIYMVQYKDAVLTKQYPIVTPEGGKSPNYAKVYKECCVENERYNTIVAECAVVNARMNRLTLISIKQIKHGEALLKILRKIAPDIASELLHGKNKVELGEDRVKQEFTDGKIQVLISTLFDEGVDIPKIDAIVDAGGGRSDIKALQLVGRGIRKYPGKTKAFVYMFIQPYAHLYKHSVARCEILQSEEAFDIKLMEWHEET